jgi:hypothetical protein
MAWTLCTSGAAIHKAGEDADATIIASGSALADYSDEAEALCCVVARSDVIGNYGTLTANGKKVFQDITSSYVAEQIIKWKPASYTSRAEATTMLNVLENNIQRNLKLIADDNYKTYLGIT